MWMRARLGVKCCCVNCLLVVNCITIIIIINTISIALLRLLVVAACRYWVCNILLFLDMVRLIPSKVVFYTHSVKQRHTEAIKI